MAFVHWLQTESISLPVVSTKPNVFSFQPNLTRPCRAASKRRPRKNGKSPEQNGSSSRPPTRKWPHGSTPQVGFFKSFRTSPTCLAVSPSARLRPFVRQSLFLSTSVYVFPSLSVSSSVLSESFSFCLLVSWLCLSVCLATIMLLSVCLCLRVPTILWSRLCLSLFFVSLSSSRLPLFFLSVYVCLYLPPYFSVLKTKINLKTLFLKAHSHFKFRNLISRCDLSVGVSTWWASQLQIPMRFHE